MGEIIIDFAKKTLIIIGIIIVIYILYVICDIIWFNFTNPRVLKVVEFESGKKLYFKAYATFWESDAEAIWLSEDRSKKRMIMTLYLRDLTILHT